MVAIPAELITLVAEFSSDPVVGYTLRGFLPLERLQTQFKTKELVVGHLRTAKKQYVDYLAQTTTMHLFPTVLLVRNLDSLEKYAYYFDELNVSYQVVDCETTELSSNLIIVPRAVLAHYLQLSGTPVVYSVAVDEADRWSSSQLAHICHNALVEHHMTTIPFCNNFKQVFTHIVHLNEEEYLWSRRLR